MVNKLDFQAKRVDVLVLLFLIAVGYIYCQLTAGLFIGRSLIGGAVFTLPAVLYLGLRSPKPWKKILLGTILFGGLLGLFFELIQEFNKEYSVISTVLPSIFGIVPLDSVFGHMMMTLLTLTFYEHFIGRNKKDVVPKRAWYGAALTLAMAASVVGVYYISPGLLEIKYSYVVFAVLAVLPILVYVYRHPKSAGEFTLMVPYFFILYLVIENVAVKHNWWIYPGKYYIGHVTLLGATYPVEELLFWMLCYAAALVTYYKIFIDRPAKE